MYTYDPTPQSLMLLPLCSLPHDVEMLLDCRVRVLGILRSNDIKLNATTDIMTIAMVNAKKRQQKLFLLPFGGLQNLLQTDVRARLFVACMRHACLSHACVAASLSAYV